MALEGLNLAIDDWSPAPSPDHAQRWQRNGDVLDVTWFSTPPKLPPLSDQSAIYDFVKAQATASRAALIECTTTSVAGCPAVQSIIKMRDPRPEHQGLLYVGSLMAISEARSCVIRVQAVETSLIGFREALVVAMNPQLRFSSRASVDSNPHLQAMLKMAPVLVHPADAANYDHLITQHPLTRVRALLRQIIADNP